VASERAISNAAALTAGKPHGRRGPEARDAKLLEQRVELQLALLLVGFDRLEHGKNVLLHGQPPEDRGLLGQIADAKPRPRYIGSLVTSRPSILMLPSSAGISPVIM